MDSFFEQLKHPNPNLRERAMLDIAEFQDENTIPRLISLLGEEDVTYRRSAVKTLGVIGVTAVQPIVDCLMNSDNVVVKASCGKALAQIAVNYPDEPFPEVGMEALKTTVDDPNPVVNLVSIMALGAIGSPALDILIEALQTTENISVSVAIVNALGSITEDKAMEVLKTLSEDESQDPYIKESAISALSRLEQVIKFKSVKYSRKKDQ
ncbi:HEAT repeat domain-containing protein [Geminocystis sp. NIES-3709]|uniref:HEAT repeat domain-containing protein n=1 Tax=Geminocystis sp. NIES-3709 TaxID=1617448 RepID=UPI0005FCC25D|nr:HEAT repeat domain-containing protein [Geminocystis sp. NIES-3709]BAQ64641.1 bilin biosynthesis protein CpeZ [Geminocystis sp. NIES-3709]